MTNQIFDNVIFKFFRYAIILVFIFFIIGIPLGSISAENTKTPTYTKLIQKENNNEIK